MDLKNNWPNFSLVNTTPPKLECFLLDLSVLYGNPRTEKEIDGSPFPYGAYPVPNPFPYGVSDHLGI